jgi:carbon-monoxide dehydrogenase small subunit
MTLTKVKFTVNNESVEIETEPSRTLLSVLRDDLKLKGAKEACGQGDCGACVVLVDGEAINACLVLVAQVDGRQILTVEGLGSNNQLHPVQQHFIDNWAFQCGYCTSGMLMSAYALLQSNPDPDPDQIRAAVAGNLCRCTGYHEIVEAVGDAAFELQQD